MHHKLPHMSLGINGIHTSTDTFVGSEKWQDSKTVDSLQCEKYMQFADVFPAVLQRHV
jgi:hypothetical protein